MDLGMGLCMDMDMDVHMDLVMDFGVDLGLDLCMDLHMDLCMDLNMDLGIKCFDSVHECPRFWKIGCWIEGFFKTLGIRVLHQGILPKRAVRIMLQSTSRALRF